MKKITLAWPLSHSPADHASIVGYLTTALIMVVLLVIPSIAPGNDIYIQRQDRQVYSSGTLYTLQNPDTDLTSSNSFDFVMRNYAPANTRVFIGPGVFATAGVWDGSYGQGAGATNAPQAKGFRVQSGCSISGYGPTTLKLIQVSTNLDVNGHRDGIVLATTIDTSTATVSNICVTNLILDANAATLTSSNTTPMYLQCLWLVGRTMQVVGVTGQNATQPDTNTHTTTECFILDIDSPYGTISTNNLFLNCIVSNFYNPSGFGTCSCISMHQHDPNNGETYPISGTFSGCKVYGNGSEWAFNATHTRFLFLTNCYTVNCNRSFNNDTAPNHSLVVVSNRFDLLSGNTGLFLVHNTSFSRIYGNTFNFSNQNVSAIYVCGDTPAYWYFACTNLLIDHNTFNASQSWPSTAGLNLAPYLVTPATYLDVENNTVASSLTNSMSTTTGYMVGNTGNNFPSQPNVGWQFTPCRADFFQKSKIGLILQDSSLNVKVTTDGTNMVTSTNTSPASGNGWTVFGSGDINRDGRTDLFLWYPPSLNIGYWFLDNNLVTASGYLNPSTFPTGWKPVGIGDFNRDNKPDIAWQYTDGTVGVWSMDGIAETTAATLSRSPSSIWNVVGTGDFNRDGYTDLVVQCNNPGQPNDGNVEIWELNGSNGMNVITNIPVSFGSWKDTNWWVVATGDYSNPQDNYTDLIFQYGARTSYGGEIRVQYMNGVTPSGSPQTVATGFGSWKVVGPK